MRGSGSVVSWLKGSARGVMVLAAMAAGSAGVWSQTAAPDTFRITEPAIPNPGGNGWSVDPRLGQLAVTIPIGVMPGEISFPVSLTMNATATMRSKRVLLGYSGAHDNQPVYGVSTNTTPIACGVNLGAITPTPGGVRITLENGRTYSSSDFEKTATAFIARTTNPTQLFSAFGFSQPSTSILSWNFPGWAVSADGSLISSAISSFPPQYNTLIDSLFWAAYGVMGTCGSKQMKHASGSSYTVLMDKDRARVFAQLPYKVEDTQECTVCFRHRCLI